MMFTPEHSKQDLDMLTQALLAIPRRSAIDSAPPAFWKPESAISVRAAVLSPAECIPVSACIGRILAYASVGCPPAVPIAVPGEQLDENTLAIFRYYGISALWVIK